MTKTTLGELATLVGASCVGSADVEIYSVLPLQNAIAGSLTLADSAARLEQALASEAAAVVIDDTVKPQLPSKKPLLICENLHQTFERIILHVRPPRSSWDAGIDPSARIAEGVQIGSNVQIGPNCTIAKDCAVGDGCKLHAGVHLMAGCRLGNKCELYPGTVLYEDTKLGDQVTLHANVVLGAFGFGYQSSTTGHTRSAQLGWVEVGSDVELGSGTTIDRGTYGPTKIGVGTKMDNQVQIGHNCQIGDHNLLCAQVGIAGSCQTGNFVVMAGQVGLADHVHLHDGVHVGAKSGVMHNVEKGSVVLGIPAIPAKQKMIEVAHLSRIKDMKKELKSLQKAMVDVQEQLEQIAKPSSGQAASKAA